jgi:hypothetical protein
MGNAATEEFVHALHRVRYDPRVNVWALVETGQWIGE